MGGEARRDEARHVWWRDEERQGKGKGGRYTLVLDMTDGNNEEQMMMGRERESDRGFYIFVLE